MSGILLNSIINRPVRVQTALLKFVVVCGKIIKVCGCVWKKIERPRTIKQTFSQELCLGSKERCACGVAYR